MLLCFLEGVTDGYLTCFLGVNLGDTVYFLTGLEAGFAIGFAAGLGSDFTAYFGVDFTTV